MDAENLNSCQINSGDQVEVISNGPEIANLCLEVKPDDSWRIVGRVVCRKSGKGIPDACVTLCTPDHVLLYGTQTGQKGDFCFSGLLEGCYSLTVSKDCYCTEMLRVTAQKPCDTALVEVSLKPKPKSCPVCPPPCRYTVCVVCKETGENISGAVVQLQKSGCSGQSQTTGEEGTAAFLLPASWKQVEVRISKTGFCTRYIGTHLICSSSESFFLYGKG